METRNKMKKKQVIRLNESQLRQIVKESVKKVLRESEGQNDGNSISVTDGTANGEKSISIYVPFNGVWDKFHDEGEQDYYRYICMTLSFYKGDYIISAQLSPKPNSDFNPGNGYPITSFSSWLSGGGIKCSYNYAYRYSKKTLKKLSEILLSLGDGTVSEIAHLLMNRQNKSAFEKIRPLTDYLEQQ